MAISTACNYPDAVEAYQEQLLSEIITAVTKLPDAPVTGIVRGERMVAVTSTRMGLCSRMAHHGDHAQRVTGNLPESIHALASSLLKPPAGFLDAIPLAMAAINSLLPIPEDVVPLKAQDLIRQKGAGKNVAIIGHFPFVDRMQTDFRNLWVFELNPQAGDLPAEAGPELIPRADVVALTSTTLLNGTCAEILRFVRKKAFVIMLGPSTPFTPCLFDWGINSLAGCYVRHTSQAASCIRKGVLFKKMHGVDSIVWSSE